MVKRSCYENINMFKMNGLFMIENIKFITITKILNLSHALPNKVIPQLLVVLWNSFLSV